MLFEYLKRGGLAGLVAGIAYGIYIGLVGNPLTEYIEETVAHGHDHGHSHGHEHGHAVSELTTTIVSIGSGVLWGLFLGFLFAVAYYFIEPALPGSDRQRPYVLAGAGFLTISVTPWLVLPPIAPGMEQTLGTTPRLLLYGGLMIAGAVLATTSILLYKRFGTHHRAVALVAAAIPIAVAVIAVPLLTPTIIQQGAVSEELASAYQGLAILSQASLWLILAVSYNRISDWPTNADVPPAETPAVPDA